MLGQLIVFSFSFLYYWFLPELLTKAMCLLSGDQELTLIVPCPPYRYAITFAAPPETGINRSMTLLYEGCEFSSMSGEKEIKAIHLPSGEICGNQSLYWSKVSCSFSLPSGFILQSCMVPPSFEPL